MWHACTRTCTCGMHVPGHVHVACMPTTFASSTLHVQRFAENLQIKKAKNETAHVQYLKDQGKNWKGSLFAFLEVARTLQTTVYMTYSRVACAQAPPPW